MDYQEILYHLFYNGLTFIVGSYIMYRIAVYLNPLNDYHVNKDTNYFRIIFGFVSILLRHLWVEISNHFSDKRPTIEEEIIEHMLRDAQQRFGCEIKKEKKVKDFKFLSKNINYGVIDKVEKINRTYTIGPR